MNVSKALDYLDKVNAYGNFYIGCVEPGYDDRPMMLANWNYTNDRWENALELNNISLEWSDEWIECDECNKGFRIIHNSYHWTMFGYIFDGFALCANCIAEDPEDFMNEFINHPTKAISDSIFEVLDQDNFDLVHSGYENGLHPGMNDDPKKILNEALESDSNGKFFFVFHSSQFYVYFDLYRLVEND